jgi:hypothetical protein
MLACKATLHAEMCRENPSFQKKGGKRIHGPVPAQTSVVSDGHDRAGGPFLPRRPSQWGVPPGTFGPTTRRHVAHMTRAPLFHGSAQLL